MRPGLAHLKKANVFDPTYPTTFFHFFELLPQADLETIFKSYDLIGFFSFDPLLFKVYHSFELSNCVHKL